MGPVQRHRYNGDVKLTMENPLFTDRLEQFIEQIKIPRFAKKKRMFQIELTVHELSVFVSYYFTNKNGSLNFGNCNKPNLGAELIQAC